MLRTVSALFVLVALVALAPCAFADEAMPAAPAAPGGPAAAPTAPMPPPAAAVVDGCGCCPAPSTCCPPRDRCRPGRLEIQAGVSLLKPDPSGRATEPSGAGNEVVWDNVDYDIAISGRAAWTFAWNDWDITAAATFWGRWDESASQSPGRLTSNFGSTLYPRVDLDSEAMVWDVNLTATKPFYCRPCFTASWGGGLRYLRFDEESVFRFTGVPPTDFLGADIDNGLLAAEGVIEGTWKLSSRWDFFARASAFAGWMHKSGEVLDQGFGFTIVGKEDSDNSLGYGGEIELALRWHMNSCWTFSLGYDFLALGQVARAFKAVSSGAFSAPTSDVGPNFSEDWITMHRVYVGVVFDL
jgi:hypothetical protein